MTRFVAFFSLAALVNSGAMPALSKEPVLRAPTLAQVPAAPGERVLDAPPTLGAPEETFVAPDPGLAIGPSPIGPVVPLYHNVRYKDVRKVDPCFVPLVVEIQDPCWKRCSRSCAPPCVAVQICVPECGQPRITSSRDGRRVKYDYGKFEVEITSKNGLVTVDYDS